MTPTLSTNGRCSFAPLLAGFLFLANMALATPPRAFAHGNVEVGDYELVIGFAAEPSYQGEPNGLDLRVTRKAAAADHADESDATTAGAEVQEHDEAAEAHEHEHDEAAEAEAAMATPVEGLEDSLQAELIFGESRKTFAIEPKWNEPGAYTAAVIPTEAGDYTWHIFGDIDGTPVDATMTSGPDTFSSIGTKADVAFPEAEPAASELRSDIAALDGKVTELAGANQTAFRAGVLGILLGLVGIIAGTFGMRRRPS